MYISTNIVFSKLHIYIIITNVYNGYLVFTLHYFVGFFKQTTIFIKTFIIVPSQVKITYIYICILRIFYFYKILTNRFFNFFFIH